MKSFIVFTAIVALAVANPLHKPLYASGAQLQEIIDAIHSPSTDPATAEKLLEMLAELTGAHHPDISPVLVADDAEPPFAGHEIVESPVVPPASPLVQIIINVKQPGSVPVPPPVDAGNAVDDADESPVAIPEAPVAVVPPPPVSGIIIADNLPAPPVTGVIVADNLPAPPSTGVVVADNLPAPPSTGVVVAEDLPAPPALGVVVAEDLPAPPALGVVVADL